MYFILLPGAQQGSFLVAAGPRVAPDPSDPLLCRLQTARDATPAHPAAESGRLQAGATATPTPCQPRWALTDCPGARITDTLLVTPAITAPPMASTTDTTTAGRGQATTSSPGLTRDSSTSDEDTPEPKT